MRRSLHYVHADSGRTSSGDNLLKDSAMGISVTCFASEPGQWTSDNSCRVYVTLFSDIRHARLPGFLVVEFSGVDRVSDSNSTLKWFNRDWLILSIVKAAKQVKKILWKVEIWWWPNYGISKKNANFWCERISRNPVCFKIAFFLLMLMLMPWCELTQCLRAFANLYEVP